MAASLGSMVVSLGLNATEFVTGLTKSEYEARKFAQNMEKIGRQAGTFLGVAATAAAAGLFVMTKNAIDAADHLNDLSKSTGIAVGTLGGLGFAAEQSGSSLEGVGKAVGKLNIEIAAAAAGNEQANRTFAAMGISVRDAAGNIKDADQVFSEVATAFASYEDGPNKAAIGNALFKKSYQDIIPLLDQGGAKLQANVDYYKKYAGVTEEVAQQADEFNDTIKKLQLLTGSFARTLAAELLPSLQNVADEFLRSKEKGDQFKGTASDVAEFLKGAAVVAAYTAQAFRGLGLVIGATAAQLSALGHGDFKGVKFIGDEVKKDIEESKKQLASFVDAINNTKKETGTANNAFFFNRTITTKRPAPSIGDTGAIGDAENLAKKILDGQIKALEASIAREKDILSERADFLRDYFSEGLLSVEQYYDQTQRSRDENLRAALADLDKEVAAAQAAKAKLSKAADREEVQNKINDIRERQANLTRDAATQERAFDRERDRAAQQYADQLDELNAKMLELAGNTAAAASIRFDSQNRILANSLASARNQQGQDQLAAIKAATVLQSRLNDEQLKFTRILDVVALKTSAIDLLQQNGSLTELDAINKRSEAYRAYIPLLEQVAAKYDVLAASATDPASAAGFAVNAAKIREQIAQMAVASDALAQKFRGVFVDAFADGITSLVTGAKTLKDVLKDVEKSIVQSISQIASKNISESLFGKEGALGGIPNFFAGLFGDKSKGAGGDLISTIFGGAKGGATAADAALVTLSTTTAVADAAVVTFTASMTAATAAATAFAASASAGSAGAIGGGVSNFVDFGQFFADGGYPPVGKLSIVGEHGPEVFIPNAAGKIIPMDRISRQSGGDSITVHVNVLPGASRASAEQAAAAVARELNSRGRRVA